MNYLSRIKHTYILEDPYEDPSQLSVFIPDASPEGKPKDEVMVYCNTIFHYLKLQKIVISYLLALLWSFILKLFNIKMSPIGKKKKMKLFQLEHISESIWYFRHLKEVSLGL